MSKAAEDDALAAARRALALAEREYRGEAGLRHLQEALALLQEVALDGGAAAQDTASNLLDTYSRKICASIKDIVDADRALPEPELRHLFDVLIAFDAAETELPDYVRALKIELVKRLIDLTYEGYPEADKQKLLGDIQQLV